MASARTRGARRLCAAGLFVLAGALAPGAAQAQVNDGRMSLTTGIDLSHAYLFRGIKQERQGVVAQPYGQLDVNLYDNSAGVGLTGVTLTVGQWNSLHSGPTGSGGAMHHVRPWYESDFYTGATLSIDNWDAGVTWTAYTSPNHAFGTTQEVAFSVQMDDTGVLGDLALHPRALLAIETAGGADGGANEGIYLELGVEPELGVVADRVTLGVPLTLGFSLSDYYENGVPEGAPGSLRDGFGFLAIGVAAAAPVPIPESYGAWEITGGVHFLALAGGYVEAVNDGDQLQVVGSFGISIGY